MKVKVEQETVTKLRQDMKTASSAEASQSRSILERISSSTSSSIGASISTALFVELQTTLKSDAARLDGSDEVDLEDTLYSDSLPLTTRLLPLAGLGDDSEQAFMAKECLELVMRYSSAKELVLNLVERMLVLRREEEEEEEGASGGDDAESVEPETWDGEKVARELSFIFMLYAQALLRIRTAKPAGFLSEGVSAIFSVLEWFAQQETVGENTSLANSLTVLSGVLVFIEALESSSWIAKGKDLCIEQLQSLLFSAVLVFHQFIPENLAESLFLKKYPKYRITGRSSTPLMTVTEMWSRIMARLPPLDLSPSILLALCTTPTSSASPSSSTTFLGSFLLLTHTTSSSITSLQILFDLSPSELIRKTQPVLMIALSGDGSRRLGDDEPLFWIWRCLAGILESGEDVDEGLLFTLVELMSSLAALSPNPSTRFLAYRFVATLVTEGTGKEEVQFMLLKDLLSNCPFDSLKIAVVGLMREIIVEKFQKSIPSIFKSPLLIREFGPILLRFQPLDLLDSPSNLMKLEDFLERHGQFTSQKLSLYYVLLGRDIKDSTGIRSPQAVSATKQHFLTPLERSLKKWEEGLDSSSESGREILLELGLLESGLRRVLDFLESL